MYESGKGVVKDDQEAAKWVDMSAKQGYAPAQSALGWRYLCGGVGVPQNLAKAQELSRLGADKGDAMAQNTLRFHLYAWAWGPTGSELWRLRSFGQAADKGNTSGEVNLAIAYRPRRGSPRRPDRGEEMGG